MKKFFAMMLCGTLTANYCGCGGTSGEREGEAKDGELKVALCVTGAVNDMGWCQYTYEGLKLVEEELGCEIAYTENVQPSDMTSAFTEYASNEYDVVIGHGFNLEIRHWKLENCIRIQNLSALRRMLQQKMLLLM